MTKPSSTHAMLVLTAPMSTTQAFEIPAPYVAASDSCKDSMIGTGKNRGYLDYLLGAQLFETHRTKE